MRASFLLPGCTELWGAPARATPAATAGPSECPFHVSTPSRSSSGLPPVFPTLEAAQLQGPLLGSASPPRGHKISASGKGGGRRGQPLHPPP